jgi:hypothetical protein
VTARSTDSGDHTVVHGFLTGLGLAVSSVSRARQWGGHCGRTTLAVKFPALSVFSG